MKTYKYLSIVSVALFIGIIGYTIGLNKRVNNQIDNFKYAGYESDDTNYIYGQILLPDMVHSDTLVVINAPYLNECLARPDVGSDGDIMEILNETTVKYSPLPNTITSQETDERGLTSVSFIKDNQEWGLDYLTKREYDSLFSNYVNYKP